MRRRVKCLLSLAVWTIAVSVVYLVLAMVDRGLAEGLVVVAFVSLLLVPTAAVETREVLRND